MKVLSRFYNSGSLLSMIENAEYEEYNYETNEFIPDRVGGSDYYKLSITEDLKLNVLSKAPGIQKIKLKYKG